MIFQTVQTHAQLQSLAWTIPLITVCVIVVWRVWPQFVLAARKRTRDRNEQDWIIMGIACAFTGKAIDASFWFVPWSLAYIDHSSWGFANSLGVFSNIIFRQGFITYAAYCHILAFRVPGSQESMRIVNTIFLLSILVGQFYPLILQIIHQIYLKT